AISKPRSRVISKKPTNAAFAMSGSSTAGESVCSAKRSAKFSHARRQWRHSATLLLRRAAGARPSGLCEDRRAGSALMSIPKRVLGRTGEQVSILCLGGWHIRAVEDDNEAIRIMHTAIGEGLTFFDNAWD